MPIHDALDNHSIHPILKHFTEEEVDHFVQMKRFFEWFDGDPEFKEALHNGTVTREHLDHLKRIGVSFQPKDVSLMWEWPRILGRDPQERSVCLSPDEIDRLEKAAGELPLVELWFRFVRLRTEVFRGSLGRVAFHIPKNPRFNAWRQRRIAAVRHELGFFARIIDHPILAFELGDGCSVGCWFCAFATRKLKQSYDYGENREAFHTVARACLNLFGPEAAGMALLYYGTEPHDNPDYLRFVKDWAEITGCITCTSTAVCTDASFVRELIGYYRENLLPWPRLSVLSVEMLHRIHELYTPAELRDVELLMQMKNYRRCKVTGGRILKEHEGLRNREAGHYLDGIIPQGSIACVTGFLVNLVHQRIQLVSPCYTSKDWPYGYRVFDEISYQGPEDFEGAVRQLIERSMPEAPPAQRLARFRDDLTYRETEKGFDLVSPNQVRHFMGKELYGPIGARIARGDRTYDALYRTLLNTELLNPLLVVGAIRELFDKGFLDEADEVQGIRMGRSD